MTKEYLESILTEYGVAFTDSLADRLLKEFEPCDNAVSRQVAIEAFQIFREYESNRSNKEWVNRIETVLNQLPPVNPQQPCNDAISRETVKIEYKRRIESSLKDESRGLDLTHLVDCTRFNEFIDSIPPVTPQKIGRWVRWYEQKEYDGCVEYIPHCKCSECGKEYDPYSSQFIKYCNECGAKMQESEEV